MNNWYSQFVRRFSAHMERTKLHETENIGMSLKGKRIVILAAGPDWIFGFSLSSASTSNGLSACGKLGRCMPDKIPTLPFSVPVHDQSILAVQPQPVKLHCDEA